MALGANLQAANGSRIISKILEKLGIMGVQGARGQDVKFVVKAGVPASNTAADSAGQAKVLCYDLTNDDIYWCSAWTSTTTHTWTKIID